MHFLLSSMSVVFVLTTSIPKDGENATMEQIRKRNKWNNDDYDSLEAKYVGEDASSKKFLPGHLKNDCKGGKVGNKANGSGINGSVDGSTNSLKGVTVHNTSSMDLHLPIPSGKRNRIEPAIGQLVPLAYTDRFPHAEGTGGTVILLIEEIAKFTYETIKVQATLFRISNISRSLCCILFEMYVKSKDIDLWHVIVYSDYKHTIKNKDTDKEDLIPYEKLEETHKKILSKNDEAKIVLYNALPKKEYERIFMCKTAKDVWNSLINTHRDLILSLHFKALDESFSSRNHVRKLLRGHPSKWRSKVTAIEESKDLSTLPLDELIGNLKVYEVVLEKDSAKREVCPTTQDDKKNLRRAKEEKKGKEERRCFKCGDPNHFISDCPKNSFNDQKAFVGGCWSDSEEEDDSNKDEICLMVLDNNEVLFDTLYYSRSSLDCESLQNEYNKLCKISLKIINKNNLLKTKNEILENEICDLRKRLERLEKNKKISKECESCVNLNSKIETFSLKLSKFENSSYFLQEMIENQRSQKDKKGLGFTEDRASTSEVKMGKVCQEIGKTPTAEPAEPVPSAREPTSSIKGNWPPAEVCLNVKLEPDEWIKDIGCSRHMTGNKELFSSREAINRGKRIQVQKGCPIISIRTDHGREFDNELQFEAFCDANEPKNIKEAIKDESWTMAMQEELNQFVTNDVWSLVPPPKNQTIIGTKWVFKNKLDENGVVSRNKARLVAQGNNQQELIDFDETYAPISRLKSIRILLAYACAHDSKLFQMDVKSDFLNGFINEEVYVSQPPGFVDFKKPNHVFKLKKALYGLKQAPKACLLYLTASRPNIMFSVCLCARFQEDPKTSHLEAETMSIVKAQAVCAQSWDVSHIMVFQETNLLSHFHHRNRVRAIDLSKNPVLHSRTKHIEIRHHFLHDNVQKGNISIEKVSSKDNIADILTKPLKQEPFNLLRLGLGLMEPNG
ncbi:retrovirus-related pol polyprotein from transposon TNT 1-94 [Tanacetum coccineum]